MNKNNTEPIKTEYPSQYWNIKDAATYLGLSTATLYRRVSESPYGTDPIPFIKLGTRVLRFPKEALKAWAFRRMGKLN